MFYRHYDSTRFDYYQHFLFPKESDFFQNIQNDRDASLHTDNVILFKNIPFGAGMRTINRIFQKPRFEITKDLGSHPYKILFFKEHIKGIKIITQMHLMDDHFFFGCYTFRNLEYTQFSLVKSALLEKYFNVRKSTHPSESKHGGDSRKICDTAHNIISCVEDVLLRICYLSGDPALLQLLSGYKRERDEQNAHEGNPLQASLVNLL